MHPLYKNAQSRFVINIEAQAIQSESKQWASEMSYYDDYLLSIIKFTFIPLGLCTWQTQLQTLWIHL